MILLAACIAVSRMASVAVAADTLRIRSYQQIDVCGLEKQAVIAIDLGEIYFGDSLMSFDITLAYDTTLLRPGSILASGTLSDQMRWMDGPFLNAAIPGELRVFGTSFLTPVKGALPLTAMTLNAKQVSCGTVSPIVLAYPAEFNEEFKRRYDVWVPDSIEFIARPTLRADIGPSIMADSIVLPGIDSTRTFDFELPAVPSESGTWTTSFIIADRGLIRFQRAEASSGEVVYSAEFDTLRIEHTPDKTITGTIHVLQLVGDSATTSIRVETRSTVCSCIRPTKEDSLVVTVSKPVVNTVPDSDERPDCRVIMSIRSSSRSMIFSAEASCMRFFRREYRNARSISSLPAPCSS
jgi:hypothetical protein